MRFYLPVSLLVPIILSSPVYAQKQDDSNTFHHQTLRTLLLPSESKHQKLPFQKKHESTWNTKNKTKRLLSSDTDRLLGIGEGDDDDVSPPSPPPPPSPSTPFAHVDFSYVGGNCPTCTPYDLENGAELKTAPGEFQALRLNLNDGKYVKIPGIDISTTNMPLCTITIGVYLESIPEGYSMVDSIGMAIGNVQWGQLPFTLGKEGRSINLHSYINSWAFVNAVLGFSDGTVYGQNDDGGYHNPWKRFILENEKDAGVLPTKQWVHVTAVFRKGGDCFVYWNGAKSRHAIQGSDDSGGLPDLYVGRPLGVGSDKDIYDNYFMDGWIKEVKVYNKALLDIEIQEESDNFLDTIPTSFPTSSPSDSPSSVHSVLPSSSPSDSNSPSPPPSPSTPFAHVDFSGNCPTCTPYILENEAKLMAAPGGFQALRIASDGPRAKIPGIDIGPSNMPECTLMIGVYLESIPSSTAGWIFGHEGLNWDRSIVLHEQRVRYWVEGQNMITSVTGSKVWKPWADNNLGTGTAPTKEWFHVTAVFRQGGECAVYVNGVKSDYTIIGNNDEGLPDLYVGRPGNDDHDDCWSDAWIKEVKVFNAALSDTEIQEESDNFLATIPTTISPSDSPSSVHSFLPSSSPSDSNPPSPLPSLSTPFAHVDFSGNCPTCTPYILENEAKLMAAPGGFQALRIASDGPRAKIPGIDIGPSNMPECTLMIGVYLKSIPSSTAGWIFGHEDWNWDRSIVLHDPRDAGWVEGQNMITSVTGSKVWKPWADNNLGTGTAPTKEWFHVTAIFRQGGECAVYVNGVKSDYTTTGNNDEGLPDLYVGRPGNDERDDNWSDAWIKEVKVFNAALSDTEVQQESERFLYTIQTSSPSDSPSSAHSFLPSSSPSDSPSSVHSISPSSSRSDSPSSAHYSPPSSSPSDSPSSAHSFLPSSSPSDSPSSAHSIPPSYSPSDSPSSAHSILPSYSRSDSPSSADSVPPSFSPSNTPSSPRTPTSSPSDSPSLTHSESPSGPSVSPPNPNPSPLSTFNPSSAPSFPTWRIDDGTVNLDNLSGDAPYVLVTHGVGTANAELQVKLYKYDCTTPVTNDAGVSISNDDISGQEASYHVNIAKDSVGSSTFLQSSGDTLKFCVEAALYVPNDTNGWGSIVSKKSLFDIEFDLDVETFEVGFTTQGETPDDIDDIVVDDEFYDITACICSESFTCDSPVPTLQENSEVFICLIPSAGVSFTDFDMAITKVEDDGSLSFTYDAVAYDDTTGQTLPPFTSIQESGTTKRVRTQLLSGLFELDAAGSAKISGSGTLSLNVVTPKEQDDVEGEFGFDIPLAKGGEESGSMFDCLFNRIALVMKNEVGSNVFEHPFEESVGE